MWKRYSHSFRRMPLLWQKAKVRKVCGLSLIPCTKEITIITLKIFILNSGQTELDVESMQMQETEGFRQYLKGKGKKDHVVEDLIRRCNAFEEFLQKRQETSLDDVNKKDMLAFLDEIKSQKTDVGNYLRAIGSYCRFTSKSELSALANNLREQRISLTRKPFELGKFVGVNKEYMDLLEKEGITNADQMLEKGKTAENRNELSKKTGIPLESILEFVKLSDLSRVEGVKSIRARLYFDAGVDTLDKMAKWDPEELRKMLISYVKRTSFDGIPPLPKEARNTVEVAKRLKRIVEYDE
jgi:hypothetical protein